MILFSVFFQKIENPKYLPEQTINFETSELNWTRHFLVFFTNNDTEGVEQCFFVVNKISPCFCDWFSVNFGIPNLRALDFCHGVSYKLLKNGMFFSSSELKIFVKTKKDNNIHICPEMRSQTISPFFIKNSFPVI